MTARCGEMLCGESRSRPKDDDDNDDFDKQDNVVLNHFNFNLNSLIGCLFREN